MATKTVTPTPPPAHEAEEHGSHHIIPLGVYYKVFAALMVGLILTLAAAAVDLGRLNILIALTIAVAKAALIVLYFMHVRFSSRLVQLLAGGAYLWLMILFVFTLADYFSRQGII